MIVVFIAAGAAIALLIAGLNLWDHRRRSAMTPQERAVDDEYIRREMQIW